MKDELIVKKYDQMSHAEWILYRWLELGSSGEKNPKFIRNGERPLDEAIHMAGGSIKDLELYLWALDGK